MTVSIISPGMLSKEKGMILRVSAIFHILNQVGYKSEELSYEISADSIHSAIAFIDMCIQQTAFIAGRGNIKEEIESISSGMYTTQYHACMTQCVVFKTQLVGFATSCRAVL